MLGQPSIELEPLSLSPPPPRLSQDWGAVEGSGSFRALPLHTFLRPEVADISILLFSAFILHQQHSTGGQQLPQLPGAGGWGEGGAPGDVEGWIFVGSAPLPGSPSSSTQNYCATEGKGAGPGSWGREAHLELGAAWSAWRKVAVL